MAATGSFNQYTGSESEYLSKYYPQDATRDGEAGINNYWNLTKLLDIEANYNGKFGDHSVQAVAGYSYTDNVYETLEEMSRGGYPPNAVLQYVSDEEIIPDKASLKPFLDILMNFLNAMPNWANNGWAPNDILPSDAQMS